MINPDKLNGIFERVLSGSQTDADIEALRLWLSTGDSRNILQLGKYNVNIGQGQAVHIGDRIYQGTDAEAIREAVRFVLKGADAEAIREAVRSVLKEEFQDFGQRISSQSTPIKTILVLASSPVNEARLRLDKEVREILTVLRLAKQGNEFSLEQRWAVRPDDLQDALLDVEPEIVHFCGHGAGIAGLALENETGEAQCVSTAALARLFKLLTNHVRCVVLNACYSEIQAEAINQYIEYVVGMNQAIGDEAAINFAKGFYRALANRRSFEDAYEFGCNAIDLQSIPEYLTPVLKKKTS